LAGWPHFFLKFKLETRAGLWAIWLFNVKHLLNLLQALDPLRLLGDQHKRPHRKPDHKSISVSDSFFVLRPKRGLPRSHRRPAIWTLFQA